MKKPVTLLASAIGAIIISCSDSAHAAMMTYAISGTVAGTITDESSDHFVPAAITDGSSFVGTISFNNAASGTVSGNNGYYDGTALDLSVNVLIDGNSTTRIRSLKHLTTY